MILKRRFQTDTRPLISIASATTLAIAVCCLAVVTSIDALAATGRVVRDNDGLGNYKIAFGNFCSDRCRLEESSDFGATWRALTGWEYPRSAAPYEFTNKPHGTYRYRIRDIEIDPEARERILEYVDLAEVVVGPVSPPPSLNDQMGYNYEVRRGDINYDGLQDLFVDRTSTASANNGTIGEIVLRQTYAGLFEMIVPTASQKATASSWPLTGIEVLKSDINLDSFVDLRLKNVAASISGADDQIVFSPAVAYSESARTIRAIDSNLEGMITDLVTQYFDESFIPSQETTVVEPGEWDIDYDCELEWRGQFGWEWVCRTEYRWEPGSTWTSYPGINGDAVAVWEASVAAASGHGTWQAVIDAITRVLRVNINLDKWCADLYGDTDSQLCLGAALPAVLAALMDATEDPRGPGARRPGTIYITGRRLDLVGAKHTALEYTDPVTGTTTHFAAYNHNVLADGGRYFGGKLRALTGFAWDSKENNVTFGTVTHPTLSPSIHWLTKVLPAHQTYLSNGCELVYHASPALTVLVNDYNSNSYVKGVIDASGGIESVEWPSPGGEPIGWNVPVPAVWFGNNPPTCPF